MKVYLPEGLVSQLHFFINGAWKIAVGGRLYQDLYFLCEIFRARGRARITEFLAGLAPANGLFLAGALDHHFLDNALRQPLLDLVAQGVLSETNRLAASRLLYRELPTTAEDTEQGAVDFAALFSPEVVEEFIAHSPEVVVAAEPNHERAWHNYLRWVLGFSLTGQARDDRVRAFFRRNPACRFALQKVTDNFVGNLLEAAERILDDRVAIQQVFFEQPLVSLERIIPTGSDSHKGGRQVLILQFNNDRRLVYKPSDVETDYRVVGRTEGVLQAFLAANEDVKNEHGGGRYAIGTQSLFMRFDGMLGNGHDEQVVIDMVPEGEENFDARRELLIGFLRLPTYRVLPCNPLSRQVLQNGVVPIDLAYGYIEYLSHRPELAVLENGFQMLQDTEGVVGLALNVIHPEGVEDWAQMDWVTDNPDQVRAAARLWGRLMAITYIAGIYDMHQENTRIWRNKPVLIDLETTFLQYNPDDIRGSNLPQQYRVDSALQTRIGLPGLRLQPQGENGQFDFRPLRSAVGLSFYTNNFQFQFDDDDDDDDWGLADPQVHRNQTFDGLRDIFDILRLNEGGANSIENWLQESTLSVVRHLPRDTGILLASLNETYRQSTENDGLRQDPSAQMILEDWDQFAEGFAGPFGIFVGVQNPAGNPGQVGVRFAALQTQPNNWYDYANFDIPYYCRRISEPYLRNSRGQAVHFHGDYFTNAMPQVLLDRLTAIIQRGPEDHVVFVTECIEWVEWANPVDNTDLEGWQNFFNGGTDDTDDTDDTDVSDNSDVDSSD